MDREGGYKEKIRKCREWISLHFLILSPFLFHFLILSPFPLHFLILAPFSRSPAARLPQIVQPYQSWKLWKCGSFIEAKILRFWFFFFSNRGGSMAGIRGNICLLCFLFCFWGLEIHKIYKGPDIWLEVGGARCDAKTFESNCGSAPISFSAILVFFSSFS